MSATAASWTLNAGARCAWPAAEPATTTARPTVTRCERMSFRFMREPYHRRLSHPCVVRTEYGPGHNEDDEFENDRPPAGTQRRPGRDVVGGDSFLGAVRR